MIVAYVVNYNFMDLGIKYNSLAPRPAPDPNKSQAHLPVVLLPRAVGFSPGNPRDNILRPQFGVQQEIRLPILAAVSNSCIGF